MTVGLSSVHIERDSWLIGTEWPIGLAGDLRREVVVRKAAAREDRQLLPAHERVQPVDGRDARLDEVVGEVAGRRVDRLAVDRSPDLGDDLRSVVARPAEAVEDTTEHVARDSELERAAKEAHLGVRGVGAARALERLHERDVLVDLEHVAERVRPVRELELHELAIGHVGDALDEQQGPDDVAGGHILTH